MNEKQKISHSPEISIDKLLQEQNNFSDELTIDQLFDYIGLLEDFRKACQKSMNFIEADLATKKIAEIKSEILIRKRKQLEISQIDEIKKHEVHQNQEIQAFHSLWNKKIQNYEEEAYLAQNQLREKHQKELESMESELIATYPLKIITSSQRLTYLKILDKLAKQKEYNEAHKYKIMVEDLEKKEREDAFIVRESKIASLLKAEALKQQNEGQVLNKRINSGRDELLKFREIELEKLLKKLNNSTKEMQLSHQLEKSKFEQSYKNYKYGDAIRPQSSHMIIPQISQSNNNTFIQKNTNSNISIQSSQIINTNQKNKRRKTLSYEGDILSDLKDVQIDK